MSAYFNPPNFSIVNVNLAQAVSQSVSAVQTSLPSFAVSSVTGHTGQVTVSPNIGDVSISLPTTVNMNSLALSTGFKLSSAPSAGYVLTSDASGNGTWVAAGGTGGLVNSINGTTNQITVTPTTGNCVVSLPSNVAINTLSLLSTKLVGGSTYTFDTTSNTFNFGSGSGNVTIILPDQTTIPTGTYYVFYNSLTSGSYIINSNNGTTLVTVPFKAVVILTSSTNSAANGNWAVSSNLSSSVISGAGTSALQVSGTTYSTNYATGATSSSAGTIVLSNTSNGIQIITGAGTSTITLPNETTVVTGTGYTIINNSTGIVTVQGFTAATVCTIPVGGATNIVSSSSVASDGNWSALNLLSSTTLSGTNGLQTPTLSTAPPSSNTTTTSFGSSLTAGTALQNNTGHDILLNISVSVSSATTATVVLGVGSTSTPTTNTAIPSFSAASQTIFPLVAYVPAGYYVLVDTTGTIVLGSISVVAFSV